MGNITGWGMYTGGASPSLAQQQQQQNIAESQRNMIELMNRDQEITLMKVRDNQLYSSNMQIVSGGRTMVSLHEVPNPLLLLCD